MDIETMTKFSRPYIFTFVLLYYQDYENTLNCIDSIFKLESAEDNTKIVLVDNYSDDGSFDSLEETLSNKPNVFFIKNSKNLGYAKGNNVGIKFAKETLNSDFVAVINTDTIIDQRDFCIKAISIFEREQYDIMGPAVKGYKTGRDQSPIYKTYEQNTVVKIFKDSINWLLWELNIATLVYKYRKLKGGLPHVEIGEIDKYKCVCSGCCLIFSPTFFDRWKGFYSETFLYREESILFYIVNKTGGRTYFSDEVMIRHKGGETTKKAFGKNDRKRCLKVYSYRLDSLIKEYKLKKQSREELLKQL